MASTVKVGDRVRLEIEGTVHRDDEIIGLVFFRNDAGEEFASKPVHLEVIEDFQPGDVVLDSDGYVYKRTIGNQHWYEMGSGDVCPDHEAVRPLTLLVREGKKV